MTFTSSFSSGTSSHLQVGLSENGDTSMCSTSLTLSVEDASCDDSDGLAAVVAGDAVAVGEDTLTSGSVYGAVIDAGAVTTADLNAAMAAAAESPEGAMAFATTFAGVSDGAELIVTFTFETLSSETGEDGSAASATSSTELVAYDLQPPEPAASGSPAEADAPVEGVPTELEITICDELDGNVATVDFAGLAIGEDSFVTADSFALAVEDELSLSSAYIELAVS